MRPGATNRGRAGDQSRSFGGGAPDLRGVRPRSRPPSVSRSQRGQALPLLLGAWALLLLVVVGVFQLGRAHVASGRAQALADLAAISAARSLIGAPVPMGSRSDLERDAGSAAAEALDGTGGDLGDLQIADASGVPWAVDVEVAVAGPLGTRATAVARAGPAGGVVAPAGDSDRVGVAAEATRGRSSIAMESRCARQSLRRSI